MYEREEGLMGHFCQVWQGLEKGCVCVCVGGEGERGEYCRIVDSSAKSGKRTGRPPAASSTHTPACQILT
jgi:hypothetical protein